LPYKVEKPDSVEKFVCFVWFELVACTPLVTLVF